MTEAGVHVRHWAGSDPPSEATIRSRLDAEGLRPYAWSNGPGDTYGAHEHDYHKVIYVVAGSIAFGFPRDDRRETLNAGDRLDLPARVRHDAVVGPRGVFCLEAHRP